MSATTLITGGAGFIGSNLAATLCTRGDRVRVLDNLSTGLVRNLDGLDVEFIRGDVRDTEAVDRAVRGCDVVIHLAAVASIARSVEDPIATHDVNVGGTLNVLTAARRAAVRRVVFAGSSAVYGDSPTLPKVETMPPAPLSPYALQKYSAEQYGRLFFDLYGLEVVTVRFFNVFGPRQDPNGDYAAVIPRFVSIMLEGRAPLIFGDGLQSRDFCYVDNAVHGTLLAAHTPGVAGRVYNIAGGRRITLLDLVDRINDALGASIEPRFADPRPGDILHSLADVSAAQGDLGFDSLVDLAEGLKRTVRWFAGADR